MDVGLWTLLDLVDLLGPITAHKTNEIVVFFFENMFMWKSRRTDENFGR